MYLFILLFIHFGFDSAKVLKCVYNLEHMCIPTEVNGTEHCLKLYVHLNIFLNWGHGASLWQFSVQMCKEGGERFSVYEPDKNRTPWEQELLLARGTNYSTMGHQGVIGALAWPPLCHWKDCKLHSLLGNSNGHAPWWFLDSFCSVIPRHWEVSQKVDWTHHWYTLVFHLLSFEALMYSISVRTYKA